MTVADLVRKLLSLPDHHMVVTITDQHRNVLSSDPLDGKIALDFAFSDPKRTVDEAWDDLYARTGRHR